MKLETTEDTPVITSKIFLIAGPLLILGGMIYALFFDSRTVLKAEYEEMRDLMDAEEDETMHAYRSMLVSDASSALEQNTRNRKLAAWCIGIGMGLFLAGIIWRVLSIFF